MKAFAAAIVVIFALVACASPAPTAQEVPTASPIGSPSGTPPPITPEPTPSPPTETVLCVPFVGPLPSGLQGDPCPAAIATVRAAVAPLDLPILRIVVEPGPFNCGDLWPGATSPVPICYGALILPGTTMHGWVSFIGSAKVAAVALGRSLTEPRLSPALNPTASPILVWTASIPAFAVPPTGWVMP